MVITMLAPAHMGNHHNSAVYLDMLLTCVD
jgi:hypothetical protein